MLHILYVVSCCDFNFFTVDINEITMRELNQFVNVASIATMYYNLLLHTIYYNLQ